MCDLSVSFSGDANAQHTLRHTTLALHPGEIVVLLGESGSGKSLLGAAIAGLLPGDARVTGSIRFEGTELQTLPERARSRLRGRAIGFVPQSAGLSLNPVRTALSQVEEVFSRVTGLDRRAARSSALHLMAELGLDDDVARLHPHRLSGGMRQRVLVAIGLAAQPRLLIADEPTKGLEERLRDETISIFRKVHTARPELALLVITHDLDVAEALADRIMVLYAGTLIEDAAKSDFFEGPRHPYAHRLLAASPRRGLVPIRGAPPAPGAAFPGCPFEPRCLHATAACGDGRPPDRGDIGHLVLCHHPVARL